MIKSHFFLIKTTLFQVAIKDYFFGRFKTQYIDLTELFLINIIQHIVQIYKNPYIKFLMSNFIIKT